MSPLDEQTHSNRSSRPVPHRLHSLQTIHSQSTPSTPFCVHTTPADYTYSIDSNSGPKRQRPGAPSRSHSFCGDSSASTYALASASAGGHLSTDKRILVAPPLERTISSLGLKGNVASAHALMTKPLGREVVRPREAAGSALAPPTPPASPLRMLQSVPIPQITVSQFSTPPRPSLSPIQQRSPTRTTQVPARPQIAPLRGMSSSSMASDRSSSMGGIASPITPLGTTYARVNGLDGIDRRSLAEQYGDFKRQAYGDDDMMECLDDTLMLSKRAHRDNVYTEEDEDMMEVDAIMEGVEEMTV